MDLNTHGGKRWLHMGEAENRTQVRQMKVRTNPDKTQGKNERNQKTINNENQHPLRE